MATLPASECTSGHMHGRTDGPAYGAAPESSRGPRQGTEENHRVAHRTRLVLVCALALALALAPGCVVRSRGQYDVGVSKTSHS